MCVRASMKAAKPLHIVLATNPNPTRARGYPLNINPKPDPKLDSISGPAGSGRVADLYFKITQNRIFGAFGSTGKKSKHLKTQRISFLSMELNSVDQIARLMQERAQSV